MKIEFFVPGIAKPAGSKRAFKYKKPDGKEGIAITHANPKTKDWMESVKWFAMKAWGRTILLNEALCLELDFIYSRPKKHFRTGRYSGILKSLMPSHKTTTPDLTKIVRAVEDALTGVVWQDDSLVVRQFSKKRYAGENEKPGVKITISTLIEDSGF